MFKSRNSTDPIAARACSGADAERMKPTCTFSFGANDLPTSEETPKGSEHDRLLILYMPNKFHDASAPASSPRSFPKDMRLEVEVAAGDFALGHLLNLLTIRSAAAADGASLLDRVAAGTATSRRWLDASMKEWTQPRAEAGCDEQALEVKAFHASLRAAGERSVLQWQVQQDAALGLSGPKRPRWPTVVGHVRQGGRLAANLIQMATSASRKGELQPSFEALPFDTDVYDAAFSDVEVFGALNDYTYDMNLDMWPGAPLENERLPPGAIAWLRSEVVLDIREVANVAALRRRAEAGAERTGERRQQSLEAYVEELQRSGSSVDFAGGVFVPSSGDADFRALRRRYAQCDEIGRAYEVGPGPQSITREARSCAFEGMSVAEFDIGAAFYQLVTNALHDGAKLSVEEIDRDFGVLRLCAQNQAKWRQAIAGYYGIELNFAKELITRIPFGGSICPDAEWGSSCPEDMLPASWSSAALSAATRRL